MARARDVGGVLYAVTTTLTPQNRRSARGLVRDETSDAVGECMAPLSADPAHEARIVAHTRRVEAEMRVLGLIRGEMRTPWTAAEVAEVRRLYRRGVTLSRIAAEVGRSKSAVAAQITRLRRGS